jgi:Uma2 family endonuclease
VTPGSWRDYLDAHPSSAVLVVEIADSRLEFYRSRKGPLYASSCITEYWIVNLVDRCIEVYRDPSAGVYSSCRRVMPGESITPLNAPGGGIPVLDIIP